MLSGEIEEPPERERDSTGGNSSFMEFAVGAILEGKVTGITKFGAFVALPGGKSGLVHISNISDSYVSDINEFLTVGQEVKVKVMNIDQNDRINLSIKHVQSSSSPRPPRSGGRGSAPQERGERSDRGDRNSRGGYRSNNGTSPRSGGSRDSRSKGANPRNNAPKEPLTFEDKLKQYMAESESRLSEISRYNDRGRSRRGRRGSGGNS